MDMVSNIGPSIKKRRAEIGVSLDEVATRAGTSKSHIWELEQGRSVNPSIRMLISVAAALNTSINTLLGADISQPMLSDSELELIQHHRRIFGHRITPSGIGWCATISHHSETEVAA